MRSNSSTVTVEGQGLRRKAPKKSGWTDLHIAAQRGDEADVVRLLARYGFLIDAMTRDHMTALHIAAQEGHDKVVAQLLARNPKLTEDCVGRTALDSAARGGHDKIVGQLLSHCPALIQVVPRDRWTALHSAAQRGFEKVVACLLAYDPPRRAVVTYEGQSRTALDLAAMLGHDKVVAAFLGPEGNHDWSTETVGYSDRSNEFHFEMKQTALQLAARNGHDKVVEKLLQCRSLSNEMISAADRYSQTALHYAAEYGHDSIVTQLLARNPTFSHENSGTPLRLAVVNGHGHVVSRLLRFCEPEPQILKFAAQEGRADMVALLLAHNPDLLNALDTRKRTPLHYAAKKGHLEVVKLLLSHNHISIEGMDDSGRTPLCLAAVKFRKEVVRFFLTMRPDVAQGPVDANGNTLLHLVLHVQDGIGFSTDLMETVWRLNMGALLLPEKKHGLTPFHIAMKCGNEWAVRVLSWQFSVRTLLGEALRHANQSAAVAIRGLIQTELFSLLRAATPVEDVVRLVSQYLDLHAKLKRLKEKR